MRTDLDTLGTEIQDYLAKEGFVVFHGYSRATDSLPLVYWDCERHPDYREFLRAAKAASASLIVFHQRELDGDMVEEVRDRLEGAGAERGDYRPAERRVEELSRYEGFVCALELSFDHQGRIYVYEIRTGWYDELTGILDDLDFTAEDQEEGDDPSLGHYFSKN